MDLHEAFNLIGHLGKGHMYYVLPAALGCNIMQAFNMCLGIFTLYENTIITPSNNTNDLNTTSSIKPDIFIFSVYEEFKLNKTQAHYINSVLMVGVLFSTLTIGKLADLYGRKKVAFIIMPFLIIHHILSTFLTFGAKSYAFWRFICGYLNGGISICLAVIAYELVGDRFWGRISIIGAVFWCSGIFILAFLAYLFRDWRTLTLACSLPTIAHIYLLHKLPESPRWLFSVGQIDKAEQVLYNLGIQNGKSKVDLQHLKLKGSTNTDQTIRSYIPKTKKIYPDTIMDMIKSRPIIVRLAVMSVVWCTVSMVYYGLTLGAADLGDNIYENTYFSALAELPGFLVIVLLMDRPVFGRKRTCILTLFFCGFFSLLIDLFSLSGGAKLFCGLVSKMLVSANFTLIYLYTCELFPTTIRSMSLGTCSFSARIGGILAPFAISLGGMLAKNGDKNAGFLLYGVFSIISSVVCIFLPETLNKQKFDNIKQLEATIYGVNPGNDQGYGQGEIRDNLSFICD